MKKTMLTLALALVQILSFAQAPAIQWQKALGSYNDDRAYSINTTTDGGYIMAGFTNSYFDGSYQAWVAKLNATGDLLWQKNYGGSDFDLANSIQSTPDGGFIMSGGTSSNDGDVTGYHGNGDGWVVKLSATGDLQWQKALGGSESDSVSSIQPTPDGGYIVAGSTSSNDGDITGYHGSDDAWVVKLSATGDLQWQKALGGSSIDNSQSIQNTTDGGYIVAGSTQSSDGDVTGSHGGWDFWVVKLSAIGDLVWQKALGGTGSEEAYSIQTTTDEGFIVAGITTSSNGDVTGFHGFNDAWIVKLSSSGALVWQKALGGIQNDYALSIQTTTDGGYVVAGQANSPDGDVSGIHGFASDYWVIKLSAIGDLVWQKALGGTYSDLAQSIKPTTDGGFIVAGYINSINGDVTGNHGYVDAWIVKLQFGIPTASSLILPAGSTVYNLVAIGSNLQWYSAATGGIPLSTNINLTSGTYFVSQTLSGVESPRTSVAVTINNIPNTKIKANQCGVTLTSLTDNINADYVAGYQQYRFEVTNGATVNTVDVNKYNFSLTQTPGITYGTTYGVRVAVKMGGVWGTYGASCNITTPTLVTNTVPTTTILPSLCGTTLASKDSKITAVMVAGASNGRYEITKAGSAPVVYEVASTTFKLSQTGVVVDYNTTYSIRVAAFVSGVWGNYGTSCTVTTPNAPVAKLKGKTFEVSAYPNPFETAFNLNLETPNKEEVTIAVYDMMGKLVETHQVNPTEVANLQIGNNFAAGIYNVIVSQANEMQAIRLIRK